VVENREVVDKIWRGYIAFVGAGNWSARGKVKDEKCLGEPNE
jgi:hypothetical protein